MPLVTMATLDFIRELEINNNRDWFQANKKRYENDVKTAMEGLAAVLIERMKEIDPTISMLPKDAVFRIYRDVRFSKDKSPYKTHLALHVTPGAKGPHGAPGLYMHIAPRAMGIASGYYMLEPANLKKMRAYLASRPEELENELARPDFKRLFKTIQGEKNKILPPDLREAAARQPLLFNKQFYYWAEYDAEEALREDLPEFVMQHMRAAQPMNDFLGKSF